MNIKEKLIEGTIIGFATACMLLILNFIWDKTLHASETLSALESKMMEIIDVTNQNTELNKVAIKDNFDTNDERYVELWGELNYIHTTMNNDKDTTSTNDFGMYVNPTPSIEAIASPAATPTDELTEIEIPQEAIQQIAPYQKMWK